jgi:hypothetical protein
MVLKENFASCWGATPVSRVLRSACQVIDRFKFSYISLNLEWKRQNQAYWLSQAPEPHILAVSRVVSILQTSHEHDKSEQTKRTTVLKTRIFLHPSSLSMVAASA